MEAQKSGGHSADFAAGIRNYGGQPPDGTAGGGTAGDCPAGDCPDAGNPGGQILSPRPLGGGCNGTRKCRRHVLISGSIHRSLPSVSGGPAALLRQNLQPPERKRGQG